jgi:hypothetical protein
MSAETSRLAVGGSLLASVMELAPLNGRLGVLSAWKLSLVSQVSVLLRLLSHCQGIFLRSIA